MSTPPSVFAATAYPFGVLADRLDRRYQLEMTALGAMLWGLQMAVTQGLLAASVADAAPPELRGTAFGIYELAIGPMTFAANAAAGALWVVGGAPLTFAAGGFRGRRRHRRPADRPPPLNRRGRD